MRSKYIAANALIKTFMQSLESISVWNTSSAHTEKSIIPKPIRAFAANK